MQVYCFVDTSFFLEYSSIAEVKWAELLGVANVIVVVPIAMLRELDNNKDNNPRKGKRERALKILQLVERAVTSPGGLSLDNGAKLLVCTERPKRSYFEQLNLLQDKPDDELVVTAYQFSQEHPQDRIVLVTADTTPRVLAKSNGLECPSPPVGWKAKSAHDESARKIAELELLVGKQPKLILTFDSGQTLLESTVRSIKDFQTLKTRSLKALRIRFPLIGSNSAMFVFNQSDTYQYNSELEYFYKSYEKALAEWLLIQLSEMRACSVSFKIANEGRATANHIHLSVALPAEFEILRTVYKGLKLPSPPKRPSSYESENIRVLRIPREWSAGGVSDKSLASAEIIPGRIDFRFERLQHGDSITVGPVRILAPMSFDRKGFQLNCVLKSDEQERSEIKLAVKLEYLDIEADAFGSDLGFII